MNPSELSRKRLSMVGIGVLIIGVVAVSAISMGVFAQEQGTPSMTEDEPNDDRANATAIEERTWIQGIGNVSNTSDQDVDFYSFNVTEGEIIRVTNGIASIAPSYNITLYSPSGDDLATGTIGGSTAINTALGAGAPENGTYYLQVSGPEVSDTLGVDGSYRFSVATTAPDAFESNDDATNATPISSEESVSGAITAGANIPSDEDWFAIELNAGQNLTAMVERTDAGLGRDSTSQNQNLRVNIIGPGGEKVGEIGNVEPFTGVDRGMSNTTFSGSGILLDTATQQTVAEETGTYYVQVVGSPLESGEQSGPVGFVGYTLNVSTSDVGDQPTDTTVSGTTQETTEEATTTEATTTVDTTTEETDTETTTTAEETTTTASEEITTIETGTEETTTQSGDGKAKQPTDGDDGAAEGGNGKAKMGSDGGDGEDTADGGNGKSKQG